ncbi:uncharacterized protein LOC111270384 isoform X2 [Varroa jacobsoni]|uniref:uncharacterized protein LOC111270384 isoform X2 n=1 Tax=Varroa jacobsoni TaxID=62625 RepID=UPI000BF8C89E|nr:uncharacterized protein LOC111270384 isoform X2 [Varroa jacobsoni]
MGQKIDKLTKQPNSFSHTLLQNKKLENSNLYVSRIIFTFINLVLLDFPHLSPTPLPTYSGHAHDTICHMRSHTAANLRCNTHVACTPHLIKVDSSLGPFEVPEILEDLTSYVLLHVKSEGLFRIGGSNERVRVLQERLLKECRHGNRKRPVDSYWQHPIAK